MTEYDAVEDLSGLKNAIREAFGYDSIEDSDTKSSVNELAKSLAAAIINEIRAQIDD